MDCSPSSGGMMLRSIARRNSLFRGGTCLCTKIWERLRTLNEYSRDVVSVDGAPVGAFREHGGQRTVAGKNDAAGWMIFQEIIPSALDVDHLQVRAQERFSVQIMTVVDDDLRARIEAVDEIAAPIVHAQDWAAHFVGLEIIHGLDRHPLGVEVRVHEAMRTDPASVD